MPLFIPLLLGAVSAIAAGKGIKDGVKAYDNIEKSKEINSHAERIVNETNTRIEAHKEEATDRVEALGMSKLEILTGTMMDFIDEFGKIKNIVFKNSDGIDELANFDMDSQEFIELQNSVYDAKKIAVNGLAAIGGGTLLAYGAYSAIMGGSFALASTGVVIGGLSGAAATNATLAWLGGGALAAGGWGMTGGMVVLGGVVIGPALAIGGSLFASQARKAVNDANSNKEQAHLFEEQGELVCMTLDAIKLRASQLNGMLNILNQYFTQSIVSIKSITEERGYDWCCYTKTEQEQLYLCVQLAKTIKIILDTKLLNDDGELMDQSLDVLRQSEKYIMQL